MVKKWKKRKGNAWIRTTYKFTKKNNGHIGTRGDNMRMHTPCCWMPRYFSEKNGKYCISVVQIKTMIKAHCNVTNISWTMNWLLIFSIFLILYCENVVSMTVRGVLSPRSARFNQGQYITSFCFYGTYVVYMLTIVNTVSQRRFSHIFFHWTLFMLIK